MEHDCGRNPVPLGTKQIDCAAPTGLGSSRRTIHGLRPWLRLFRRYAASLEYGSLDQFQFCSCLNCVIFPSFKGLLPNIACASETIPATGAQPVEHDWGRNPVPLGTKQIDCAAPMGLGSSRRTIHGLRPWLRLFRRDAASLEYGSLDQFQFCSCLNCVIFPSFKGLLPNIARASERNNSSHGRSPWNTIGGGIQSR